MTPEAWFPGRQLSPAPRHSADSQPSEPRVRDLTVRYRAARGSSGDSASARAELPAGRRRPRPPPWRGFQVCTGNRARKARPRGVLAGRQLPAPTQSTVCTETPSPPRQRPDPGGQPAPPEAAAWFPGTRPTPGREGAQGQLRTGSPAPPDRPHGRDLSPRINEPQPAPSHVPSQKNVSVPTTAATTTPEQETGADGIVRCRETSLHRGRGDGRWKEGRGALRPPLAQPLSAQCPGESCPTAGAHAPSCHVAQTRKRAHVQHTRKHANTHT